MSQYKFETIKEDYSHYSSGNVFASGPGNTGFPVRLASEVFQTCFALMPAKGHGDRVVLYDPCCGAGYLLASIGFRHCHSIERLVGSDADDVVLKTAERNLSMLTRSGLSSKLDYLVAAQAKEWRESREAAIRSVQYFLARLSVLEECKSIGFTLFQADAGSAQEVLAGMDGLLANMVIADIPYGGLAQWHGRLANRHSRSESITALLESIRRVVSPDAVIAIISPKGDSVAHPAFGRRRRLKLGKRMVTFLSPEPLVLHPFARTPAP